MKNLYTLTASCCSKIITIILFCLPVAVNAQESMRANLYVVDANGATLVDGNLTNYNNIYSNAVDMDDAWKMTNPGINFGLFRENINLVVERRSIVGPGDTTFFKMWNMPQYNYQIRFVLKNLDHPDLKAIVKDNFLHTETSIGLNDTTYYNFSVTADASSADQMRFQLIFGTAMFAPVPVNFTDITAQRKTKDVLVEWSVATEISVESYMIEHSADGRNFTDLQQVTAYNTPVSKTYTFTDITASAGDNFYRIKATNMGGKTQYSTVVRVKPLINDPEISVYPNPVANKTVHLQFNNMQEGKYNVVLLYNNGLQQQLSSIQLSAGQSTQSVNLPQNLLTGIYRLQVTGTNNQKIVKSIQVL